MKKEFILIILFALLVLVTMGLFSKGIETIDETKAKQYVMQELENYTNSGSDVKILFANETNGKWEVKVKLSLNPTEKCPNVHFRVYTVPDMSFRYDPYTSSCNSITPPLVWPEEAQMWLIYSKNAETESFLNANTAANAYTTSVLSSEIPIKSEQCASTICSPKDLLISLLSQGEVGSESFWLVEWRGNENSLFVAVNQKGKVLGHS